MAATVDALTSTDLRALVHDAIADGLADPRQIVAHVVDQLDDDKLREALMTCMSGWVRSEIRSDRRRKTAPHPEAAEEPGQSRWQRQADDIEVYARLECVRGEWMTFGDCTREDVQWLGHERLRIAQANKRWAGRYGLLSKAMRDANARTVRDLPAARVKEILNA